MKNKHEVHNLIILDESGSMLSIKKNIIKGFNPPSRKATADAKAGVNSPQLVADAT